MNDEQRYLFDLQGYLIVPEALSRDQVAALNATLDQKIAESVSPDATTHRFGVVHTWGKAYFDVLDNPRITPILEAINGSHFRLDHGYIDIIRGGTSPIGATLHGGGTPWDPSMLYHVQNGNIYCSLVVVAYNLADVNPGDGGFACVPGSHKANFKYPDQWKDLTDPKSFVARVAAPAGAAIVFTEALTHGPLPWTGKHERRTLFYKYNHSACTWAINKPQLPEGITERQREILTGIGNPWARDQAKIRAAAK